jgi:hypothetical protein
MLFSLLLRIPKLSTVSICTGKNALFDWAAQTDELKWKYTQLIITKLPRELITADSEEMS